MMDGTMPAENISLLEQRDVGQYDQQPEAVAGGLPAAERSHNRIVQTIA
jgi:hypothetical protein